MDIVEVGLYPFVNQSFEKDCTVGRNACCEWFCGGVFSGPETCITNCGNTPGILPLLALFAMLVSQEKANLLVPGEYGTNQAFTKVTAKLFQNSLLRKRNNGVLSLKRLKTVTH